MATAANEQSVASEVQPQQKQEGKKVKVKLVMLNCPAAERNRAPIFNVLQKYLEPLRAGAVLEIGSGSGQHVTYFGPLLPRLTFYPSDIDDKYLQSVGNLSKYTKCTNVRQPIRFDARASLAEWKFFTAGCFDAIYCSNVIHISSTDTVEGIFKAADYLLRESEGLLIVYGPFAKDGVISPESNVQFNEQLKSQNPDWGLRDLTHLNELAKANNLKDMEVHDLPANNNLVVWHRNEAPPTDADHK